MVQSVMALVTILVSCMFGACWGTKIQIRRVQKAQAEGIPHENVTVEELTSLLDMYWCVVKFLIGILAVLVVMDRFAPNLGV